MPDGQCRCFGHRRNNQLGRVVTVIAGIDEHRDQGTPGIVVEVEQTLRTQEQAEQELGRGAETRSRMARNERLQVDDVSDGVAFGHRDLLEDAARP